MEVVGVCRERGIPFLGVCYGHQVLARALGGRVGRHPDGLELGNTPVTLTPAGRECALFDGLPDRFDVLSSHADAVLDLPPGAELTASGGFTPCQGFLFGPRLLGVQFHPESDPDTLRFLWSVRRDDWRPRVRFDLDHVLEHLEPTPVASRILRNFATRVVV
jgi:GMP synthase (glutamine-hydrolysing)